MRRWIVVGRLHHDVKNWKFILSRSGLNPGSSGVQVKQGLAIQCIWARFTALLLWFAASFCVTSCPFLSLICRNSVYCRIVPNTALLFGRERQNLRRAWDLSFCADIQPLSRSLAHFAGLYYQKGTSQTIAFRLFPSHSISNIPLLRVSLAPLWNSLSKMTWVFGITFHKSGSRTETGKVVKTKEVALKDVTQHHNNRKNRMRTFRILQPPCWLFWPTTSASNLTKPWR